MLPRPPSDTKSKWIPIITLVGALFLSQGCTTGTSATESGSKGYIGMSEDCKTPSGLSGEPQTIEEAMELINALPKPLSVSCFLQSLKRPLKVTLTDSLFSAQPANGRRSPRVFIFSGDLIISVVPDGPGAELMEFGQMLSDTFTIKGELSFPVQETLPLAAPFDHIDNGSGTGTVCAGCHRGEYRVPEIEYANAFASAAIKPSWATLVPLASLKSEFLGCDADDEPDRCSILNGLFVPGDVEEKDFPENMPTF